MPVWLASNLYPMWLTYRLLEGYRALTARATPGARYDNGRANGEELQRAKDDMLKFWVIHAALQLFGNVVSTGTFAGALWHRALADHPHSSMCCVPARR